ncbi:hypothetical protein [Massilia suwonensis]|uniref:Uncharacterized protein n=1 Tax=Massilia suwonensis TaxID=648895 RepID=A0ABW0MQ81_9BURK
MKTLIKKTARRAQTVPVLGRLVRIAIAIVRLPELRAEVIGLASGSYAPGARPARPALWRAVDELRENTAGDANLARSVPVALRRLTREVHALRQRLDAAGLGADAGMAPADDQAPRLCVAPEHAAAAPLRLYLGQGETPPGYVRAGFDETAGAVPPAPGAAAEIQVAWLFETLTQAELRDHALPQLFSCLQAGGRLRVQATDAGAALAAYAQGACEYDALRDILYGAADRDGRLQLNMLSPASLGSLLGAAGFMVTHATETGMHDGRPGFEILADKPAPAAAH